MALFGRPNVERLKTTGNIAGLIKALTYNGRDASEVRKAAMEALGDLRATAAVEPLLRVFADPHGDMRIGAARALRAIGDARTVDPFIQALRDPSSAVQEQAALALEQLHDPRAVPALVEALQTQVPQGEWRPADRAIAQALLTLAHTQAEPLIAILRSKKREGWEEAVVALGTLHDPRAVDPLVEVALDNEAPWATRRTALKVLETLGWQPSEDQHRLLCALAARRWEEVEAFGASAIEPLLATLRVAEEPDAQQHAIALLVKFRVTRAVGPLVEVVRATERGSARRTLSGQAAVIEQAALQALKTLLEQKAEEIPTEGLRKVLLLRDEVSLTRSGTPQEREAAERALFGPEQAPLPRVQVKYLAQHELYRRGLRT